MESVIDLLARLVAKIITGLEPKKAELLKQIAKDKAKHKAENTDFRIRIEELGQILLLKMPRHNDAIAKVVKLFIYKYCIYLI